MEANIPKSPRQLKNDDIRERLIKAMDLIIKKYDYNTVTIRNICTVSGVSYGSFYNLFKSKDAFLTFYLSNDYKVFKDAYYQKHTDFQKLSALEQVIDVFQCIGRYNEFKGIDFIRGFYSPSNTDLFLTTDESHFYVYTNSFHQVVSLLEQAVAEKHLSDTVSPKELALQLTYIFNGISFNWCISGGRFFMEDVIAQVFQDVFKLYSQEASS